MRAKRRTRTEKKEILRVLKIVERSWGDLGAVGLCCRVGWGTGHQVEDALHVMGYLYEVYGCYPKRVWQYLPGMPNPHLAPAEETQPPRLALVKRAIAKLEKSLKRKL